VQALVGRYDPVSTIPSLNDCDFTFVRDVVLIPKCQHDAEKLPQVRHCQGLHRTLRPFGIVKRDRTIVLFTTMQQLMAKFRDTMDLKAAKRQHVADHEDSVLRIP
jgi:hypothetical protein